MSGDEERKKKADLMATYSRKRKYTSLLPDPSPSPPQCTPPPSSSSPLVTLSTLSRPALQPRDTNTPCGPSSSPTYKPPGPSSNTGKTPSKSTCTIPGTTVNPASTSNPQAHPQIPSHSNPAKRPQTQKSKKRLTQLTLDLGGPVHIQCPYPRCGMQYIPSHAQDAALHRRHHASVVGSGWDAFGLGRMSGARRSDIRGGGQEQGQGGWVVPKWLLRDESVERVVMEEHGAGSSCRRVQRKQKQNAHAPGIDESSSSLLIITRTSSISARNFALTVLESAEAELGAVKTASEQLWSRVCTQTRRQERSGDAEYGGRREDGRTRRDDHDKGKAQDTLPTPPGSSPPPPPSSSSPSSNEKEKQVPRKIKIEQGEKQKPMDNHKHKHSPTCLEDKHALILSIAQPPSSSAITITHAPTTARSHKSVTKPAPTLCSGVMLTERIRSARRVVGARQFSSRVSSAAAPPPPPRPAMQRSPGATTTTQTRYPSPQAQAQAQAQATAQPQTEPQALTLSPTPLPAHTGISRIFVSPSHRGRGIAESMLDSLLFSKAGSNDRRGDLEAEKEAEAKAEECGTATSTKKKKRNAGGRERMSMSKAQVAFSPPTEMGRRLAERWVGVGCGVGGDGEGEGQGHGEGDKEGDGWMIYDDERDGFEVVSA